MISFKIVKTKYFRGLLIRCLSKNSQPGPSWGFSTNRAPKITTSTIKSRENDFKHTQFLTKSIKILFIPRLRRLIKKLNPTVSLLLPLIRKKRKITANPNKSSSKLAVLSIKKGQISLNR